MRRRIVPRLVAMPGDGDNVDDVYRLDQTAPPRSARTQDRSVVEAVDAGVSETGGDPWYETVLSGLSLVVVSILVAVNATINFVYRCCFAMISLALTPVALGLRATRMMPWRIDVRVDGVLVDKQFAHGGPDTRRLIDEIGRQLSAGQFRTTDPRAVGPDSDPLSAMSA